MIRQTLRRGNNGSRRQHAGVVSGDDGRSADGSQKRVHRARFCAYDSMCGVVGEISMNRFNLGAHTRNISTTSPEARRWFAIGLNWVFGFNVDAGSRWLQKGKEYDPDCAMVYWAVAYSQSPFYNLLWREQGEREADTHARIAYENILKARSLARQATEVETQ